MPITNGGYDEPTSLRGPWAIGKLEDESIREESNVRPRHPYRLLLVTLSLLIALPFLFPLLRAQVATPRPEELRFQMLLHEPVAAPDRRSVVAGTDAVVVKDRRTGQCYVAVSIGQSMAMTAASCEE